MTLLKKLLIQGMLNFPLKKNMIKFTPNHGETAEIAVWSMPNEKPVGGIGMELEMGLNPLLSEEHREWLFEHDIYGTIREPSRFNDKELKLQLNASTFKLEQMPILYKVIGPNTSPLTYKEMLTDKTINKGMGGGEIQFSPTTRDSLSVLKIELTRMLYYMNKMGCTFHHSDASVHLQASTTLLGDNADEIEQTLTNILWFMFRNKEFMTQFCNRVGDGLEITNLYQYLGDPFQELKPLALERLFMIRKKTAIDMFRQTGSWRENAEATVDERWKGFMNLMLNDEFQTLEFRWFGTTNDVNVFMSYYEFYFALINFCRLNGVFQRPENLSVMEAFYNFVKDDTNCKHLLWRMAQIEETKDLIEVKPVFYPFNMDKIINFDYEYFGYKPYKEEVAITTLSQIIETFKANKEEEIPLVSTSETIPLEEALALVDFNAETNCFLCPLSGIWTPVGNAIWATYYDEKEKKAKCHYINDREGYKIFMEKIEIGENKLDDFTCIAIEVDTEEDDGNIIYSVSEFIKESSGHVCNLYVINNDPSLLIAADNIDLDDTDMLQEINFNNMMGITSLDDYDSLETWIEHQKEEVNTRYDILRSTYWDSHTLTSVNPLTGTGIYTGTATTVSSSSGVPLFTTRSSFKAFDPFDE